MKRLLSTSFLALLTACMFQSEPTERKAELSLSASVTEGVAPLEVTFSASVTPGTITPSTYTWTLAGRTLSDTAPDLTHMFNAPGVYIVTATAETPLGSAADSTSVTVTQAAAPPSNPGEPVGNGTLDVTKTPGGPAPWAVRYRVQMEGYGADAQFSVRCSAEGDIGYAEAGGAVCLHTTADEKARVDVLVNGKIVDSVEVASEVTPPQEGVAFLGTWRNTSRGQSDTFAVTQGTATAGESQSGAFKLFVIEVRGVDTAEFTFSGRTVVLRPTPEADGRQVYLADVYGLRLERLD